MSDYGYRVHVPEAFGKHKTAIGFCREETVLDIEIVKKVPVELLKKQREAFEELRMPFHKGQK